MIIELIKMKKNIAIVAGGYSSEAGVSLRSAKQIEEVIDKSRYHVYTCLSKKNRWILKSEKYGEIPVNKDDSALPLKIKKLNFIVLISPFTALRVRMASYRLISNCLVFLTPQEEF